MIGPPLAAVDRRRRRALYGVAAAGLIGIGLPMSRAERAMMATGGPGIVGLELAGSTERVDRIFDAWGDVGRSAARTSLRLDQLWLTTYAVLLAGASTWSAERLGRRGRHGLARLPVVGGWAALTAGGFDAIENTALLGVVTGRGNRGVLARLGQRAAQTKFALLGVTTLGLAAGLSVSRSTAGRPDR